MLKVAFKPPNSFETWRICCRVPPWTFHVLITWNSPSVAAMATFYLVAVHQTKQVGFFFVGWANQEANQEGFLDQSGGFLGPMPSDDLSWFSQKKATSFSFIGGPCWSPKSQHK